MSQPDNPGDPFPPPIDQQPWYIVDLQRFDGADDPCGPDCPPQGYRQRVEGLAQPVAAWLRAQADLLDPPRPVARPPHWVPGGGHPRRGSGFDILPPPTP